MTDNLTIKMRTALLSAQTRASRQLAELEAFTDRNQLAEEEHRHDSLLRGHYDCEHGHHDFRKKGPHCDHWEETKFQCPACGYDGSHGYSHCFTTLYDERDPGDLGRGTHYSVLRAVVWPRVHDFAVVWDEDHDTRISGVIEHLHLSGLLHEVLLIGERKGSVTIITKAPPSKGLTAVAEKGWSPPEGDWFNIEIEQVTSVSGHLINAFPEKVQAYVDGIVKRWNLGTYIVGTSSSGISMRTLLRLCARPR